jgi:hypothetical protein
MTDSMTLMLLVWTAVVAGFSYSWGQDAAATKIVNSLIDAGVIEVEEDESEF